MTEPQPPRAPIDLRRPRDLGALIADGVRLYLREFRTFIVIAAAVVVPVELIVSGVGLGQFTAEFDRTPDPAEVFIPFATSLLVAAPLTAAMSIYALLEMADGRRPSARRAIQRGLDVFAPLLLVVLLYAVGVFAGLLMLILPGIYLAIRWVFYIQAVVVEKRRGFEALEHGAEFVRGSWWRVFGSFVAISLLVGGLSALVGAPFQAAADASGEAVFQLVGQIIGGVLFAPAQALMITLLYFDQQARKG